jgi:hypothetical protein
MTQHSATTLSLPELAAVSLTGESDKLDNAGLDAARSRLNAVLLSFLKEQKASLDEIHILDGFYFIFDNAFADGWQENDWWDQRELLKIMQTNAIYRERTIELLKLSIYNQHYTYKVGSIPDQDKHLEQYASRRERLYLKEGYENAIDALSHAAYYRKKYIDMYPGLLQLLFTNGESETIIIVDNGIGRRFHKPSRRIAPWRLVFKIYKLIMNHGVYYIGGMHLGLKVTYGRLSCYGDGAVVMQAPFTDIY